MHANARSASAAAGAACAAGRLAGAAPALSLGTALAAFAAVFGSVSLRIALRPAPAHLFPLLSEVDARAPERTVLRMGALLAAALLAATAAAARAHAAARSLAQHDVQHKQQPQLLEQEQAKRKQEQPKQQPQGCYERSASHHLHYPHPQSPVQHLLPQAQVGGISSQLTLPGRELIGVPALFKRNRRPLLATAFIAVIFLAVHSIAVYTPRRVRAMVLEPAVVRSVVFVVALLWLAMFFSLMWYFIQLQESPEPASTTTGSIEVRDISSLCAGSHLCTFLQTASRRLVSWMRPLCLSLQVASMIKIAGLVFALETFRISRIILIRTALLAALAFAEYSAAFSFSAFLVILAVDMRRVNVADTALRAHMKVSGSDSYDSSLLV